MGTITQKLTYLNETKAQIRAKINETSDMVNDTTTFREYSSAIGTLNKAYNPFLDKIGYSYSKCEKALNKPLKVAYKSGYLKQDGIPTPDTPQEIEVYEGVENLFDKDNANILNVYFNTGNDKKLTSTTQARTIYMECKTNTTYTISKRVSSRFYFGYTKEIPSENVEVFEIVGYSNSSITNLTITTGSEAKYLVAFVYHTSYDAAFTFDELLESIQLEKGNVSHPYVPYKNDKYDENNPTLYPYHTNYALIKNSGKNLFDKDNVLMGKEIIGNTGNVQNNEEYFTTDYIKVEPNTNYFLSGKNGGRSNCFYDKNKTFITVIYNLVSGVITIPNNENICYMRFNAKVDSIDTTMITKGSTDTTYEPYREPTYTRIPLNNNFLAKIGDIKDEIDLVSGELRKRINKVVLNGSESWSSSSKTEVKRWVLKNVINSIQQYNLVNLFCNYDTSVSPKQSDENALGISRFNNNGFLWNFDTNNSNVDTLDKFKAWLSTHNTEVYYLLATQQVIQLNNSTIPMFNGTNILSLENDLENTFGITYFKE